MYAIYFITDENLADLASAAALQMSLHWDCDFHIFIERRDPTAPIREVGEGRITYHYEELGKFLPENLPEIDRWPRIVYLRFFAPKLLSHYKRLLHLDADILTLYADPELWDVPLPSGLGAVSDLAMLVRGANGMERDAWLSSIGVNSGRYPNAGVMLIDPVIWNKIDFASLLPAYFKEYPGAIFQDQDFVAHHFDGLWTELSPRFNWQAGILHWGLTRIVAPVFLHFNMVVRPWLGEQADWLTPNDPEYINIYARVLRYAGLPENHYYKTFHLPKLRRVKYAMWKLMVQQGIYVPRERRRREEWFRNHAFLRDYINQGLENGHFAADRRLKLESINPQPYWDGRFIRIADDLPPGDPLNPAEANNKNSASASGL